MEYSIRNKDKFLHTTQVKLKNKQIFNAALPVQNQVVKKKLKKTGPHAAFCDVHTWMKGWVYVLEDEIGAVSDPGGRFKLEGVPAGDHTIMLWHETLGTKTVIIVLLLGAMQGTSHYVDIALLYALLTIFSLLYLGLYASRFAQGLWAF